MDLAKFVNNSPVITLGTTTVLEGVKMLHHRQLSAVLIIGSDQRLEGIFTERDNMLRVTLAERDARTTLLSTVMTTPVITARSTTTVDDALMMMVRHHFLHLPIVDENHIVKGMVNGRDLLLRRIGEKEAAIQTLNAYVKAGGPG